MTPNKKIIYRSFLYGLGRLKLVPPNGSIGCKSQTFWVEEATEFRPRRGMMSRYAQRVVNNSFYGIIEHDGA